MSAATDRARASWRPLAMAALLLALATREVSYASTLVVVAAGAVGLLLPVARTNAAPLVPSLTVLACGLAVFGLPSVLWGNPAVPVARAALGASLVAAVCEEAFFRRGMFGWLERHGPAVAVAVTALAFAAVHVPHYGWGAAGVNLAAGFVFGWQRWATGRWSVPAATHAFANLVASL